MDWIDLAKDNDQWRALVNMVINFKISKYFAKFSIVWRTGGSSKRTHLLVLR
jgi:hypothetical protein